jgi:transcriptional regulator with XRE-family HTH domain
MNKKLAYLMKLIGMTEQKLGKALNVDSTLINKWKNGKRAIAPTYLKSLIDALADALKEAEDSVRKRAAAQLFQSMEEDGIRTSIERYLLNDSVPVCIIKDAQSRIYSYLFENLEEGAEQFFSEVGTGKGGIVRVFLSSADDLSPAVVEGIAGVGKSDKKLEAILCAAGNGSRFFELLNSTFRKGCSLRALNRTKEDKGFFVYEGGPALSYFRSPGGRLSYCEYFSGGVRAAYLEEVFAELKSESRLVFSKALFAECAAVFSEKFYSGRTYVISAVPELLLLTRDTIANILMENGVAGVAAEAAAGVYLSMKNIYLSLLDSGGVCAAFYPYEKEKRMKSIRSGILSAIAKKEIMIRGSLFDKATEENDALLKHHPAYSERRVTVGMLPDLGCLVREYGPAVIWKHCGEGTRFYLAKDPLCSDIVCRAAKTVWNGLPSYAMLQDQASLPGFRHSFCKRDL